MKMQELDLDGGQYKDVRECGDFRLVLSNSMQIDISERGGTLYLRTNVGRLVVIPEVCNAITVLVAGLAGDGPTDAIKRYAREV